MTRADVRRWLAVALVPPMAVRRTGGPRAFWIAVASTAAGYLPGVGYAAWRTARLSGADATA